VNFSNRPHRGAEGLPAIYSARVTLGDRAVGVFEADEVAWFWIGERQATEDAIRLLDGRPIDAGSAKRAKVGEHGDYRRSVKVVR
jgi:hypothetical protein